MIKEALEYLGKRFREADGMTTRVVGMEPVDVFWLDHPKFAEPKRMVAEPAPRAYWTASLAAFIHAVQAFRSAVPGSVTRSVVVFCWRGSFAAVYDEEGARRERVSMKFTASEAFKKLTHLATVRQYLSQREFLHLLRLDLHPIVPADLIARIRSLKFTESKGGEATIEQGKESLGHEIRRRLIGGEDALPESVELEVPVYEEHADDVREVQCGIDINLEDGTFALIPLAGELASAQRATDAAICKELADKLSDATIIQGQC